MFVDCARCLTGHPGVSIVAPRVAGHRLLNLLVAALLGSCLAASPALGSPPSFVPSDTIFATGWWPVSAVADLNDDGRADIVAGGGGGFDGSVTVQLAQPGGGYAAAGTYPVGGSLHDLRLIDVSGDGRLDIVAAGQWDVTVLHAQPGGGYAEAFTRSLSGDLGIVDLDGDGGLDLVYTYFGSGDVFVASAQPDGTYAVQSHPVRGIPKTVQLWDWTGDGRLDVLAVNAVGSGINSLLAGVPGGLAPAVDSYAGWDDGTPILADFDGDGDTDRAQLREDRWGVIVRTARGDGEYDYREHWPGDKIRQGPLAGDFDGDGRTDLAMLTVSDEGTSRLSFLLGTPGVTFAEAVHHPLRDNSRGDFAFASGELDGDGRPDLVLGEDYVGDDGGLEAAVRVWPNRTPIVTLSPPTHTTARSVQVPYTVRYLAAVEEVRLEVKTPGATDFEPQAVLDPEESGTVSIPTEQDGEWRFRATAHGAGGRVLDTTEAVTDIERPTTLTYSQEPIGSQPVGFPGEPKRIGIENRGEATLRIRGVEVSDGIEFKLVRDECSGKTFAPQAGCDVYVVFTPAREGERTGTLTVDGNVPPIPLDVHGVGVVVSEFPTPPPTTPGPQFPGPKPSSPAQRAPRLAFDARPGARTTKLKRLRIEQLAPGSTVTVRCARGCSRNSLTKRAAKGTLSLASFVRTRLRAGTTIRVVISEPGKARVVLTLKIRSGRAPSLSAR
jgi:hypothetical protein